jgi:hypothetical protein
MAHPLISTVPLGVKEWQDFVAYYTSNKSTLYDNGAGEEQKAVQALFNYVKYADFDENQKTRLINQGLQPWFRYHPNGSKAHESLTNFSRLCVDYLFTDKEVFEAFQEKLGGKQNKENEEKKKQEEEERRKQAWAEQERQRRTREEQYRQKREEEDQKRQEEEREEQARKKREKGLWFWGPVAFLVVLFLIIIFLSDKGGIKDLDITAPSTVSVMEGASETFDLSFRGKGINSVFIQTSGVGLSAKLAHVNWQQYPNTCSATVSVNAANGSEGGKLTFSLKNNRSGVILSKDVEILIPPRPIPPSPPSQDVGTSAGVQPPLPDTSTDQQRQDDIVGVWKGWYEANQGKTKLVLTIHSDMTGVFEFSNFPGKSNVRPGSYTVVASYSNGTYFVRGNEWLRRPASYIFLNISGKISHGKFSGKTDEFRDFQLDKVTTVSGIDSATKVSEREKKREAQIRAAQERKSRDDMARRNREQGVRRLIATGMSLIDSGIPRNLQNGQKLCNDAQREANSLGSEQLARNARNCAARVTIIMR